MLDSPLGELLPAAPVGPRAVPRVGLVLAAGRSERLQQVTGGGSKALVRLGGLTLIERAVRSLLAQRCQRVLVVVGHHGGTVGGIARRVDPAAVRAIHAENWEAGNGVSLAAAGHALANEDLFVLITTDHVFGEGTLDALLEVGEPAALVDLACDPSIWEESTKVRIRRGRTVRFGKELSDRAADCGAFVLSPQIFEAQRLAQASGDASLSGALNRMVANHSLKAVPVPPGSWWRDIDTVEDLHRARVKLRKSLTKDGDGPVSRYLNRPISSRISMVLAPLRLSPDVLSVLALAVGFLAAGFLASGRGILGALLVHLASILDGVDGEVARLQVRASPRGALLDGVLDRIADAAMVAGLGIWSLSAGASTESVLILAVAATSGTMLSMASKDRIAALGLPRARERLLGWLLGGRDGRLFIVAVMALVGEPAAALAAVTATSAAALALRVFLVRRYAARVPTQG